MSLWGSVLIEITVKIAVQFVCHEHPVSATLAAIQPAFGAGSRSLDLIKRGIRSWRFWPPTNQCTNPNCQPSSSCRLQNAEIQGEEGICLFLNSHRPSLYSLNAYNVVWARCIHVFSRAGFLLRLNIPLLNEVSQELTSHIQCSQYMGRLRLTPAL